MSGILFHAEWIVPEEERDPTDKWNRYSKAQVGVIALNSDLTQALVLGPDRKIFAVATKDLLWARWE